MTMLEQRTIAAASRVRQYEVPLNGGDRMLMVDDDGGSDAWIQSDTVVTVDP